MVVLLFALTIMPLQVGASELTEEEEVEFSGAGEGIRWLDEVLRPPEDASTRGFWVWPEGDRAFFLNDHSAPISMDGFDELIAVDLETFEEVGRGPLQPAAWASRGGMSYNWAQGTDHMVAVDRAGGRLFVPYGLPWRQPGSAIAPNDPTTPVSNLLRSQRVCTAPALTTWVDTRCVGGIHVVDAASLEVTATIPLESPLLLDQPGNGGFMPMLRAVRYSPRTDGAREGGKAHIVVEDIQHHTAAGDSHDTRSRFQQFGLHYLIQFDADTGVQDWAVRVDACRGTRDGSRGPDNADRPHPADLFRDPGTGDFFVGCTVGSGHTAVVVRVPVGVDGEPPPRVEPTDLSEASSSSLGQARRFKRAPMR